MNEIEERQILQGRQITWTIYSLVLFFARSNNLDTFAAQLVLDSIRANSNFFAQLSSDDQVFYAIDDNIIEVLKIFFPCTRKKRSGKFVYTLYNLKLFLN